MIYVLLSAVRVIIIMDEKGIENGDMAMLNSLLESGGDLPNAV